MGNHNVVISDRKCGLNMFDGPIQGFLTSMTAFANLDIGKTWGTQQVASMTHPDGWGGNDNVVNTRACQKFVHSQVQHGFSAQFQKLLGQRGRFHSRTGSSGQQYGKIHYIFPFIIFWINAQSRSEALPSQADICFCQTSP